MSACTTFAQSELHKHGWHSGKGLGKYEDGMKEAIKVKRKDNTSGLGHNIADEFTFHWWDHVFNKAAKSIEVKSLEDGVTMSRKADGVETALSTKKPCKNVQGKSLLYGTFVRAGTYKEAAEEDGESSDEDEDLSSKDTLEKTFKLTGLTGHKGARHGHTMSGKLKRILDQESNNGACSVSSDNTDLNIELPSNRKSKKVCVVNYKNEQYSNLKIDEKIDDTRTHLPCNQDEGDESKQERKKKKKKVEMKRKLCEDSIYENNDYETKTVNVKKKKKRSNSTADVSVWKYISRNNVKSKNNFDSVVKQNKLKKKKKKKRKKRVVDE